MTKARPYQDLPPDAAAVAQFADRVRADTMRAIIRCSKMDVRYDMLMARLSGPNTLDLGDAS